MNIKKQYGENAELVWKDRKRFMGMPLSFTRYRLIKAPGQWFKIFSDIGFTYSVIEEINLYRIYDISLRQSLFGKLFNTGTITLFSNDERTPRFVLQNVKDPFKVRDMFSNYIEQERQSHNVRITEFQSKGF